MLRPIASPGIRPRGLPLMFVVLALFTATTGCEREAPTTPGGRYSLNGRVSLTGSLVDTGGRFLGTWVVDDADGVEVELRYGSVTIARTTTVKGTYRFTGLAEGAYRARAQVIGDIMDETPTLTIRNQDVNSVDVLRLASRGDLSLLPNPSPTRVDVYFTLPDTQFVDLRIRDLSGGTTRQLLNQVVPPGLRVATWSGYDKVGQPATGGLYWITFESGRDKRAHLLFR